MNFTYSFTDDPINEQLVGNITWKIPSPELPAHWVHAEYPCKCLVKNSNGLVHLLITLNLGCMQVLLFGDMLSFFFLLLT